MSKWYKLWLRPHFRGVGWKIEEKYELYPDEEDEERITSDAMFWGETKYDHLENGFEYGTEKVQAPPADWLTKEVSRVEEHTKRELEWLAILKETLGRAEIES